METEEDGIDSVQLLWIQVKRFTGALGQEAARGYGPQGSAHYRPCHLRLLYGRSLRSKRDRCGYGNKTLRREDGGERDGNRLTPIGHERMNKLRHD